MAKRKIVYDKDEDEDDDGDNVAKKSRRFKQVDAAQMEESISQSASARRSMRSSKGTGGQLARMQQFERIQTQRTARPSKMDLATQGEDMNPMAPSFQASARSSGGKSRAVTAPETGEPTSTSLSLPASSSKPVFSRAASGDQFGFRLPDSVPLTQAPPRKRIIAANSDTSSRTSTPPASLFSGRSFPGTSTTSSSRASSVCSFAGRRTYSQVAQQQVLPPQSVDRPGSLQPSTPSSAGTHHHISADIPPSLRFEDFDNPEADLHRSNARLSRTASFYHLPLSMDRDGHSLSAAPRAGDEENAEIDEASPSEDERFAEEMLRQSNDIQEYDADFNDVLHDTQDSAVDSQAVTTRPHIQRSLTTHEPVSSWPSFGNTDFGNHAEDVVAAYRGRNHAPRLPSNSQLLATRSRQPSSRSNTSNSPVTSSANVLAPPLSVALPSLAQVSEVNPPSLPGAQGPPVGPATEGSDPWQLQYYDPATRDIIERAKQFSHCDAASINAFPLRVDFNAKAIEYIDEAIAERRSRSLVVSEGWWPHHSASITRLLWEDLGNWRSALRKKARTWAAQRYRWDPENRREQNADIAKQLLGGGGIFLRDGTDEEGHVNNLAHPALSGLVIDFFYASPVSVGKLFPEVFAASVPRTTVALAATALKVVLDEFASPQSAEVSFKVSIYSAVYTEILGLMDKCDSSTIHGTKTRVLREKWARLGSGGAVVSEARIASGFDVDLT